MPDIVSIRDFVALTEKEHRENLKEVVHIMTILHKAVHEIAVKYEISQPDIERVVKMYYPD